MHAAVCKIVADFARLRKDEYANKFPYAGEIFRTKHLQGGGPTEAGNFRYAFNVVFSLCVALVGARSVLVATPQHFRLSAEGGRPTFLSNKRVGERRRQKATIQSPCAKRADADESHESDWGSPQPP